MSQIKVNAVTDGSGGNTATINSMTPTADSLQGFRNRLINGSMVIDQRNSGASVTPTGNTYTIDRWFAGLSQSSKFSVQRSTTAPTGFINSALITSTSAYSITSTDRFAFSQFIEGFNCTDLGWGTASAKTMTLSFQVRSSLTGTFGGAFQNNASDRSYPFTYTISAANTWETKTVTVAGDTTGTWLTNNEIGIQVRFSLGTGSTYSNTAGAWVAGDYRSATGATSVVGTNGATFYITGVQLEVGSVATPFERRDYGRELMMCQRYYEKSYDISVTPGTNTNVGMLDYSISTQGGSFILTTIKFTVPKRGTPTMTAYTEGGTSGSWGWQRSGASGTGAVTFDCQAQSSSRAYVSAGSAWVAARLDGGHWVASAEL
jgi:hypothetical protein